MRRLGLALRRLGGPRIGTNSILGAGLMRKAWEVRGVQSDGTRIGRSGALGRKWRLGVGVVVAAGVLAAMASSAAADAISPPFTNITSASSSAYGESLNLSGALTLASGPLPSASGIAAPSFALTNTILSLSIPGTLSAGLMQETVSGSTGSSGGASASSTTAGATVLFPLLSASAIGSGCSVNATSFTGSSSIANLVINGQPITVSGQPNQTVTIPGGEVIINEQIVTPGSGSLSVTVNAIHVELSSFSSPFGAISGDIIISHSQCSETGTTAPPPTGTLTGHIYLCQGGHQTTTEVPGGTIAVSQGSSTIEPAAPNPVSYTLPAGTYTLTATAPPEHRFVACGTGSSASSQNVTVPAGGSGSGIFYVCYSSRRT